MAVAAVCVVAAGVSGMKAYNVANQSQAEMLLAENIDALSQGDYGDYGDYGDSGSNVRYRWIHIQQGDSTSQYFGLWEGSSEKMDGAKHSESHSHGYSTCNGD